MKPSKQRPATLKQHHVVSQRQKFSQTVCSSPRGLVMTLVAQLGGEGRELRADGRRSRCAWAPSAPAAFLRALTGDDRPMRGRHRRLQHACSCPYGGWLRDGWACYRGYRRQQCPGMSEGPITDSFPYRCRCIAVHGCWSGPRPAEPVLATQQLGRSNNP